MSIAGVHWLKLDIDRMVPVVARHPQVREVAVIGVEDEKFGQALVAHVALRNGGKVSSDELRAHVRARRPERTPAVDLLAAWDRLTAAYPGDALAQLRAWLAKMAERLAHADERGCALVNAAVELPEKSHPARRVIEEFKTAERTRLTQVCRATGLNDPDALAEELHLMLQGARVTAQNVGRDGLSDRVMRMGEALIAAHARD